MATVRVQAGQSLLESYVKSPATGLCELVWNAFDEDANDVVITCEYNGLGGIEQVVIDDNGNGMTRERAEMAFSRVGDSWKIMPGTLSAGDRPVHGRYGRGRYSAFALGSLVRWLSVSEAVEGGDLATTSVTGSRSSLDSFDISETPND